MLTEIDHVAIAVNDLEAAIEYYRNTYGVEVVHREVVERDGVEEALLKVAESYVQLLTPVRDDSTVAKYLATKGEGIHHVGYRVDDCAAALERVRAEGGRLIDEAPRPTRSTSRSSAASSRSAPSARGRPPRTTRSSPKSDRRARSAAR